MRALVFGLLGAAILCGGAEARKASGPEAATECAVSEREFTIGRAALVPDGRVTHPELVGRSVRPVRWAAARRWNALEVDDGARRYVVRFDIMPRTTPAVMGSSFEGSAGQGVNWASKAAFGPTTAADIYDGPLAGLTLGEGVCK
ncbi:hypothetical protein [Methylobacterium sp. A54F]